MVGDEDSIAVVLNRAANVCYPTDLGLLATAIRRIAASGQRMAMSTSEGTAGSTTSPTASARCTGNPVATRCSRRDGTVLTQCHHYRIRRRRNSRFSADCGVSTAGGSTLPEVPALRRVSMGRG